MCVFLQRLEYRTDVNTGFLQDEWRRGRGEIVVDTLLEMVKAGNGKVNESWYGIKSFKQEYEFNQNFSIPFLSFIVSLNPTYFSKKKNLIMMKISLPNNKRSKRDEIQTSWKS